jgi:hypothetical protein
MMPALKDNSMTRHQLTATASLALAAAALF